jgi:hypothetical protein
MTEPLSTLFQFTSSSTGGCDSEVFVFGHYTVISGNGGLFGHTHAIVKVKITPDLRALGAVFAFTQTQAEYLHNHGGVYYVKKPTDRGCSMPSVYQFVNGASIPTSFLNRSAWHFHRIYVIYTPYASSAARKKHRKHVTRERKGDGKCRIIENEVEYRVCDAQAYAAHQARGCVVGERLLNAALPQSVSSTQLPFRNSELEAQRKAANARRTDDSEPLVEQMSEPESFQSSAQKRSSADPLRPLSHSFMQSEGDTLLHRAHLKVQMTNDIRTDDSEPLIEQMSEPESFTSSAQKRSGADPRLHLSHSFRPSEEDTLLPQEHLTVQRTNDIIAADSTLTLPLNHEQALQAAALVQATEALVQATDALAAARKDVEGLMQRNVASQETIKELHTRLEGLESGDDCSLHDAYDEYADLTDIGRTMVLRAYQTKKYSTPELDVDVCDRCTRVRKKSTDISHALLVFR